MTVIWILLGMIVVLWVTRTVWTIRETPIHRQTFTLELQQLKTPKRSLYITYFGQLKVPDHLTVGIARIRLIDVTNEESPLPVLSLSSTTADEHGWYSTVQPITFEHNRYTFASTELSIIPLEGMLAPYHGKRTIKVHVEIAEDEDAFVYCEASASFTLRQTRAGYRELHENVEPWQHLVERLDDSVRAIAETTSPTAHRALNADVDRCLDEILEHHSPSLAHNAYQRVLEGASITLTQSEAVAAVLQKIAQRLCI